jgi:uroporphyrinogen-III decarboxylase
MNMNNIKKQTHKSRIRAILNGEDPGSFVFAPNLWQWFYHHKHHKSLPKEIAHCESQLDLIGYLDLAVFSRNVYSDQTAYWFGGLADCSFGDLDVQVKQETVGSDIHTRIKVNTTAGTLEETLRYIFADSTVVQDTFLLSDYANQLDAIEQFIQKRRWTFNIKAYEHVVDEIGDDGCLIVGESFSPLKMLHLILGPVNTTYMIMDYPEVVTRMCETHEKAQLDLVEQMAKAGVPAMMAMDNLDTAFHPPYYIKQYCASYYEKASRICHKYGSRFLIHACGQQKANLKIISDLGVDGLEGVAYPPLGNVSLLESLEETHDRFIVTGGISATEIESLKTEKAVCDYIEKLFTELKPYRHRFVLAPSCNTPINATFDQILWFRQAWMKFKDI